MNDRIVWQAGDEFRCKRCGEWHRTFVGELSELRYLANLELRFNCPRGRPDGLFYASRVGEPVHELARWRRPSRELSVTTASNGG